MTASQFAAALRAEGLNVVEVGDWETHNRNHKGPWGPVHGVMIHHTVTRGSTKAQTDSSVALCRDGRSDLPGPLCHGVIAKDGTVYLVGYGRTNHAGMGDDDVEQAVINETNLPIDDEANTDGNRAFYGFECINLGDGEDPWPPAQLLAIEKAAAAICRHHGWGPQSVIGHLEWQPGKVDPRGFTMQTMRGRVAARLDGKQQEDDVPITDAEIDRIARRVLTLDGVIANPVNDPNNTHIALASSARNIEIVARRTEAKVAALTEANTKLVDTVAQLAAGIDDIDPATIVAELRQAIESIDVHISTDLPEA
jgi:hypothetical protein